MRVEDIEVGGVYRGKAGTEREVTELFERRTDWGMYEPAVRFNTDGRYGGHIARKAFAAWAKERVR